MSSDQKPKYVFILSQERRSGSGASVIRGNFIGFDLNPTTNGVLYYDEELNSHHSFNVGDVIIARHGTEILIVDWNTFQGLKYVV